MIKWCHAFFNAMVFLTRIPAPPGVRFEAADLNRSARFFPLIGILIGALGAGSFWVANYVWPIVIAVGISMVVTVLLTGAFHEDGLADVCDGFGGGWDKSHILKIMKDSRLGTFGTLGLVLAIVLKWMCLASLEAIQVVVALLVAHSLSRWAAIAVIALGRYASSHEGGKPKPLATQLNLAGFLLASLFGFAPTLLLPLVAIPVVIALAAFVAWRMYRYYVRWIDGYTGDGLGAIQQVSELGIYLVLVGFWS